MKFHSFGFCKLMLFTSAHSCKFNLLLDVHFCSLQVREEQMVLSHTPLKMFDWFFNKHVLISGQQDIKEIVQGYPFQPKTQPYIPDPPLQEFGTQLT